VYAEATIVSSPVDESNGCANFHQEENCIWSRSMLEIDAESHLSGMPIAMTRWNNYFGRLAASVRKHVFLPRTQHVGSCTRRTCNFATDARVRDPTR
jgi:hypothetical protein